MAKVSSKKLLTKLLCNWHMIIRIPSLMQGQIKLNPAITNVILAKVTTQWWSEPFSKVGFGGCCMTRKTLKKSISFGLNYARRALWNNSNANWISLAKTRWLAVAKLVETLKFRTSLARNSNGERCHLYKASHLISIKRLIKTHSRQLNIVIWICSKPKILLKKKKTVLKKTKTKFPKHSKLSNTPTESTTRLKTTTI